MTENILVLIADDSSLMRRILSGIVSKQEGLEVVGEAINGKICLEMIESLKPDVVLMDLNMPELDGFAVMERASEKKMPTSVLILSAAGDRESEEAQRVLASGAFDFIPKPGSLLSIGNVESEILEKIGKAHQDRCRRFPKVPQPPTPGSVDSPPVGRVPESASATGAQPLPAGVPVKKRATFTIIAGSSGGPEAIQNIVSALPEGFRGVVIIVLRLPGVFVEHARSLIEPKTRIKTTMVADGAPVRPGTIYLVPNVGDDFVLQKSTSGRGICFKGVPRTDPGEAAPSANRMMASAGALFRGNCVGMLVSGTGDDGVQGLKRIKELGGRTLVQDSASSTARQLALAALGAGVVDKELSPQNLAGAIS